MARIEEYKEVRCVFGGEDPGKPKPGEMFVFYQGDVPEMVEFLCPCGCGNNVPTHVIPIEEKKKGPAGEWKRGCWGFDPKTLTLFPSIRWTSGCKAHFNIENGRTVWHSDSGK